MMSFRRLHHTGLCACILLAILLAGCSAAPTTFEAECGGGQFLLIEYHDTSMNLEGRLIQMDGSYQTDPVNAEWVGGAEAAISPDGESVISFSLIGEINRIDLQTGDTQALNLDDPYINQVIWSPDGTKIAFRRVWGDSISRIYILDLASGMEILLHSELPDISGRPLDWNQQNQLLYSQAIGEDNDNLVVLDLATLKETTVYTSQDTYIANAAWMDDGQEILIQEFNGEITRFTLLNPQTGEREGFSTNITEPMSLLFSPNRQCIAYERNHQIYLYSLERSEEIPFPVSTLENTRLISFTWGPAVTPASSH